MLEQLIESIK